MLNKTKILCCVLAVIMSINFSVITWHKDVYAFVDGGVIEGTVIGTVIAGALAAWGISTTSDIASSIGQDFYDWGMTSGDKSILELFQDIEESYNDAVKRGVINAFALPFLTYVKLATAFKDWISSSDQTYFNEIKPSVATFGDLDSINRALSVFGCTVSESFFNNRIVPLVGHNIMLAKLTRTSGGAFYKMALYDYDDNTTNNFIYFATTEDDGTYLFYGSDGKKISLLSSYTFNLTYRFVYNPSTTSTTYEPAEAYADGITVADDSLVNAPVADDWVNDNSTDNQKEIGISIPLNDVNDVADSTDVLDGTSSESSDTLPGFWDNLGTALQNLLNGLLSPFRTVIEYLKKIWAWLIGFELIFTALSDYLTSDNTTNDNTDDDSNDSLKNYLIEGLEKKFPFCIPFDLATFVGVLCSDPITPKFDWHLTVPQLNLDVPLSIDLSDFDDIAAVVRRFELLIFCVGLLLITRNIINS